MGMIRHLLSLKNTTRHSILSSSTLQTHLSSLTHSYSTSTANHDIHSVLPKPFTVAHKMSLRFHLPKKGDVKELAKINREAETAQVFCAFAVAHQDYDPKIGDGEAGGGIVLNNAAWGDRALFLANEVLSLFGNEYNVYAFQTSPDGCILLKIDSFSDEYGCPSVEMLNSFFKQYKERLDEDGAAGIIPDDLALSVGSPGPQRVLKVPDDLTRFKSLPMRVSYVDSDGKEREWVFFLRSVEKELGYCLWDMSDFDPMNIGKPLSRKEGSWRLKLPFEAHKRVTFFVQPLDVSKL